MAATQISKKRKFVADGVFYAELNAFLIRELSENGYSGVEVRVTPQRTEIIIQATKTKDVLGDKGRRIRELTAVVQKRFNFPDGTVELYAERVSNRGLCALAQCESLKFKLRAQRAKSMKFKDGYMIKAGDPVRHYIDTAIRHVLLRQGILGLKVQIMLPHDPSGKQGPKIAQPDVVRVLEPKEEEAVAPSKVGFGAAAGAGHAPHAHAHAPAPHAAAPAPHGAPHGGHSGGGAHAAPHGHAAGPHGGHGGGGGGAHGAPHGHAHGAPHGGHGGGGHAAPHGHAAGPLGGHAAGSHGAPHHP